MGVNSRSMTLTVQGEVERITYENEVTGFRVVRLGQVSGAPGNSRLTVVGVMPPLGVGVQIRAAGRLEDHKVHGAQLAVQSVVVVAPETLDGIEKFLGSGVLPGVGESTAKRVVKSFGLETLRVLDQQSHRLSEVPGLGPKKVEKIRSAWVEHQHSTNLLLVLQKHGITPLLIKRIVARFAERSAQIVEQHPYRLALEVSGIGFKTADQIARARGLPATHPERAQAGVMHQLTMARDQGHCYCDRGLLVERTAAMLGIDRAYVEPALDQLWAGERVVIEGERVFLRPLHAALERIALQLSRLLEAPGMAVPNWKKRLAEFEGKSSLELGAAQKSAVQSACENKLVIVTGGPGVGKTTLVRALLSVLDSKKVRIQLAAPTGRAAQRLAESTGKKAVTLHRLLEVGHVGKKFARNGQNPLECDILVIDEVSMIDVEMMDALLQAIPVAARLVLVGDADQLPSVGPGAVLLELIESGVVPVVRLTEIFRQGIESGIVHNSHRILAGELPEPARKDPDDFYVMRVGSSERCLETVRQLVTARIAGRFGFDPARDIQVLCPMHRGSVGTTALNQMLQVAQNPGRPGLKVAETELRQGDKVIQLKNDYDKLVFNGDVGEVEHVDFEAETLRVRFVSDDGARLVHYERSELTQLNLAYCLSVHKSQGSEYPAVVLVILKSHFMMLSRNLLYTAVTRAKKLCVVVTDDRALGMALSETRREVRATGLAERLRNAERLMRNV